MVLVRDVRMMLFDWSLTARVSRTAFAFCVTLLVVLQLVILELLRTLARDSATATAPWPVVLGSEAVLAALFWKTVQGRYVDAGIPSRRVVAQVVVFVIAVGVVVASVHLAVHHVGPVTPAVQSLTALGLVSFAALVADAVWVLLNVGRPSREPTSDPAVPDRLDT
jgi:hypothetical protein